MKAHLLAGALLAVLCFASCGRNYYDVIPEKSPAIARISPSKMHEDAPTLRSGASGLFPFSKGIDLSKDLYAFITPAGYYGMVMPVSDASVIDKSVAGGHDFHSVDHEDDISFAMWGNNWCVAWDDDALIVLGPVVQTERAFIRRTIAAMFRSDGKVSDGELFPMLDNRSPISMVSRASTLPSVFKSLIAMQASASAVSDSTIVRSDISIKENSVVCNSELFSQDGADWNGQGCFLPLKTGVQKMNVPAGAVAVMHAGLNGKKLIGSMEQDRAYKPVLAALNMDINVNKIIGSINGDACIFFKGVPENGAIPVSIEAEAPDKSFINDVPQWMRDVNHNKKASLVKENDGLYTLRTSKATFSFGFSPAGKLITEYIPRPDSAQTFVPGFRGGAVDMRTERGALCNIYVDCKSLAVTPFIKGLLSGKLSELLGAYSRLTYISTDSRKFRITLSR